MDLKQKAIIILQEIDLINDEIYKLKKVEQNKRIEINNIKKAIENENSYLIGKKALCSSSGVKKLTNVVCTCNSVMCTDSFEIKPLFNHKGEKYSVDTYIWI